MHVGKQGQVAQWGALIVGLAAAFVALALLGRLRLRLRDGADPLLHASGGRLTEPNDPYQLIVESDRYGVAEYFVEYVRQQLDAKFGSQLYRSGYRIYTTLDLDTQQAAERALEARLEAIESGADGKFTWPSYRDYQDSKADNPDNGQHTTTPYLQGLVVTLDAKTGQIRAMVGGRDFNDSKFNRATQALRQPGSSIKPLTYLAALHGGLQPNTLIVVC